MILNSTSPFGCFLDTFDEFFSESVYPITVTNIKNRGIPATNIKENDMGWFVEMAAPGVGKDNFDVKLDDKHLIVKYEEKDFDEDETEKYIRKEFSYSAFTKTFIVPENVNGDNITSEYINGVLKITFPKILEEVKKKVKNIEIS